MRLLWISGRDMGRDLAGTTEKSLTRELVRDGCELTFISPGSLSNDDAKHIKVSTINFPGLNTLSGSRSIKKILESMDLSEFDVALIDWRYILPLQKFIQSLRIPWCIIDRGPPATSGIIGGKIRRELLRNIQKKFWKKGWKIAEECAAAGFVVSQNHETIVRRFAPGLSINHIPAGAYSTKLEIEKGDPSEMLRLVYVGRIDRKRGVSSILNLSEELNKRRVSHSISIAGEGNMKKKMMMASKNSEEISFLGRLEREEVDELLSVNHVGIMPMPDIPIWRISSPLKLAEYLSSGLAIVGPEHPGNTIASNEEWSMLTSSESWVEDAAESLSYRISRDWKSITESAIRSSKRLSWSNIGESFGKDLQEIVDDY